MHLVEGGAEIQLVAKPRSKLIRVAFNRLRRCPKEISNVTDSESEQAQSEKLLIVEDCKSCVVEQSTSSNDETTGGEGNRWKHRLRPRRGKRGRRGRAPKGRGHVIDCY